MKRRSDKKKLYVREICFNETLSVNQTFALFKEIREMKKIQKNKFFTTKKGNELFNLYDFTGTDESRITRGQKIEN